ncbi:DinB family protein [Zavarzinella formosa]|uniref:DinB family protein n=1 Tax=Zavarzinella formosa TaxID=360055 RepID=UPI0002F19D09|nr:DinB family protein [Zavarzinella formosa]
MNAPELIRLMHRHRAWVTARLLNAVRPLTEEQLRQPFAIGQGSVWQSLLHLYAAEYVWLDALKGDEHATLPGDIPGRLPGNQLGEGGIKGFPELEQKWGVLDKRWDDYLSGLTETSLDETVFKVSTSSGHGLRFGTKRAEILVHVCTHAQYTVAQTVNMIRQAGGASLPDVMMITLARLGAN